MCETKVTNGSYINYMDDSIELSNSDFYNCSQTNLSTSYKHDNNLKNNNAYSLFADLMFSISSFFGSDYYKLSTEDFVFDYYIEDLDYIEKRKNVPATLNVEKIARKKHLYFFDEPYEEL